jgi:adenine-specific DNA-methyltransferase
MTDYHAKGQYFTEDEYLQNTVTGLIFNIPSKILEPSIGRGDLVMRVQKRFKNVPVDMYELDNEIVMLEGIKKEEIVYGDFMIQNIDVKYDTIIGNPPYVKTKTGNLYIDFIDKCYHLLENNGELIFIVPSDFLKLTSAVKIIKEMMLNGTFTHIVHPNKENLFKNASIDIIIFRYCKNKSLPKKTLFNGHVKHLIHTNGMITFSDRSETEQKIFQDYFKVAVGMVTGKESVYKNKELGNIQLLNKKGVKDDYILVAEFPTEKKELNEYLLEHKDTLIGRKIKKFNESNWFEWGAPRNVKLIEENMGKKCIYISNLTRQPEVAFIDKVQYFGGALLMLLPKEDIDLKKVVNYLNSESFKKNFIYSGRFKIGHRQLSNSIFNV